MFVVEAVEQQVKVIITALAVLVVAQMVVEQMLLMELLILVVEVEQEDPHINIQIMHMVETVALDLLSLDMQHKKFNKSAIITQRRSYGNYN